MCALGRRSPKNFAKVFRSNLETFETCPFVETSYTVLYIVPPCIGSVQCFCEMMIMSFVGMRYGLGIFSFELIPRCVLGVRVNHHVVGIHVGRFGNGGTIAWWWWPLCRPRNLCRNHGLN